MFAVDDSIRIIASDHISAFDVVLPTEIPDKTPSLTAVPLYMRSLRWSLVNRVVIVGCGGSGKSHLARQLAERLDLPLTHLDAVYYDEQWNALDQDEFTAVQKRLIDAPRWVIEGNYAYTLPVRLAAADTVVVLDLPARTCLRSILQRRLRYRGGQHTGSGVYDRINWSFVRYVLGYRRTMLPRVHRLIANHARHADITVIRRRRATRRFLEHLSAERGRSDFDPSWPA